MPGLQTRGFALSALQDIPEIPQNIGKIDVGAIYDAAARGVNAQNLLASNDQTQQLARAARGSALAQIPSETQAGIAKNTALATTAPAEAAATVAKAGGEVAAQPSATGATIAKNESDKLNSDINGVYAKAGLAYAPQDAQNTESIRSGLLSTLAANNGAPTSHPITTPDGRPLGSIIAYADGNGQAHVQFAPMPFGALTRINTGISYQPIGTLKDPETGQDQYMQYQTIMRNAAGGISKGDIVKTAVGDPPPGPIYMGAGEQGAQPAAAAGATGPVRAAPGGASAPSPGATGAQPAGATAPATAAPGGRIGAQVAAKQAEEIEKQRLGALDDLKTERDQLSQQALAIGKIAVDAKREQDSALGANPVTGKLTMVRPAAQAVEQDIGTFANQVMSTVKNIRNQREFNAVTASIPHADDFGDVQNAKIEYLRDVNGVMTQRNAYQDKLLRENPSLDPDAANAAATGKFPFPEPSWGWKGSPGKPAGSAASSSPSPEAAAFLKANPNTAVQFDAKYGAGSSQQILGTAQ